MVLTLHRSAPHLPRVGGAAPTPRGPIRRFRALLLKTAFVVIAIPFAIFWRRTPDGDE